MSRIEGLLLIEFQTLFVFYQISVHFMFYDPVQIPCYIFPVTSSLWEFLSSLVFVIFTVFKISSILLTVP